MTMFVPIALGVIGLGALLLGGKEQSPQTYPVMPVPSSLDGPQQVQVQPGESFIADLTGFLGTYHLQGSSPHLWRSGETFKALRVFSPDRFGIYEIEAQHVPMGDIVTIPSSFVTRVIR